MTEYCHEATEDEDIFPDGQSAVLFDTHPNADGANGKYWKTDAVPVYIGRCANCNHNLMDGGEYSGWSDIEGVQEDVFELNRCTKCDWPLSEHEEESIRESLEEDGVVDVDELDLPALMQIHEQVLKGTYGIPRGTLN